ncbi:hypothetical protein KR044_006784 [Drosophila immigrans]|nr:hypothetical protein KR044_006784 [Drosophila immigrans]
MTSNRRCKRPFRFTEDRLMKFVELYRRESCLWNRQTQLQTTRNSAYKRIQTGINNEVHRNEDPVSVLGVKMKINTLRSLYLQELTRINANSMYKPKISWFAPLHDFLAPYMDKQSTRESAMDSLMPERQLRIKLHRMKNIKQSPLDEKSNSQVPMANSPASGLSTTPSSPPLNTKTAPPARSPIRTAPQIVKFPQNCSILQSLGSNEFTFFGLSVGAQLCNMPLSNAMIMQSKIQNMLSMERRKIDGDTSEVDMYS